VSSATQQVRRLVEHRDGHPVVSLYVDLDPERFATPPARSSQIRSLIDQAVREARADDTLSHDDRVALLEDLERLDVFLHSPDAPFKGARALAVFCSGPDGLFETIPLSRPVPGRVVVGAHAHVEPMLAVLQERRWLVALVNRREAWLWAGSPDRLQQHERVSDSVHGRHEQGGWSQARYQRSVEKDVDDHLRNVAGEIERHWRAERLDRLAVGGPQETVPRLLELLGDDLRAHLASERIDVDLSEVGERHVREAVERVVEADDRRTERELLDRLAEGAGGGGRATMGLDDTVEALNERRVAHLLIDPGLEGQALRCPACGLLVLEADGSCPADGSPLRKVKDVREAVVEAAVVQDAAVTLVRHHEDLQRVAGIGALLRF
jgi:peptide chain release factor subunit 1